MERGGGEGWRQRSKGYCERKREIRGKREKGREEGYRGRESILMLLKCV